MRKYERFLYNLKADLRFYRELLLGTPWVEREENKNKKKPCLFITEVSPKSKHNYHATMRSSVSMKYFFKDLG